MDNKKQGEVCNYQLDANWASDLIQTLGFVPGFLTTSERAESFLKRLLASEERRQLEFMKVEQNFSYVRIALRTWREKGVPVSSIQKRIRDYGDNDVAIALESDSETIVVELKKHGIGYIVHTELGDFSHFVKNGLVPDLTQEWVKIVCKTIKLAKKAGHTRFSR